MKMIRKIYIRLLCAALQVLLVLSVLVFPPLAKKMIADQEKIKKVLELKDKKLEVEVAATAEKRSAGLMFRKNLEKNSGMLFVFEKPAKPSFWMLNTEIPLSLAFLDEKGRILQFEDMQPKDLIPVSSKQQILYVLEVNKGWFEANNIVIGDIVKGLLK
jgi:uncharacterized membrane protein (UPF0127 family)